MTSIDTTRERIADIVGNTTFDTATQISDAILAEFVVIPRSELPEVSVSDHADIGLVTVLAQQRYQPSLVLAEEDGDKTDGTWNRRIAYANFAVAEAVERQNGEAEVKRDVRRDKLAVELYQSGARFTYAGATTTVQRAIDRIIDVEGRLAVYGEQA